MRNDFKVLKSVAHGLKAASHSDIFHVVFLLQKVQPYKSIMNQLSLAEMCDLLGVKPHQIQTLVDKSIRVITHPSNRKTALYLKENLQDYIALTKHN